MTQSNEWNSGYVDKESDPRVVKRMAQVHDITMSDLISWCEYRYLDPETVVVTATHLKWSSPETDEEREKRIEWEQHKEASTEKWERETLERLSKKYGATP